MCCGGTRSAAAASAVSGCNTQQCGLCCECWWLHCYLVPVQGGVRCLRCSEDCLVTGSWDTQCIVWDLIQSLPLAVLTGHTGCISCMDMADGHMYVCFVCSWQSQVRFVCLFCNCSLPSPLLYFHVELLGLMIALCVSGMPRSGTACTSSTHTNVSCH